MGYQGFAKVYTGGPASGDLVILTTGSSVNLVLEPIYSTSVWGAGWYNAADAAHYADAAIRYEGTLDFELQGGDDIWDFMKDWAIRYRAYPRSFDISPDGARVYQYRTTGAYNSSYDLNGAWCTELGLNTSEGSFVTASGGLMAITRTEVDPAGGHNYSAYSYINQKGGVIATDCTILAATNPLNPSGTNVNPIPFWRTDAKLHRGTYPGPFTDPTLNLPQTGLETVEWSITITNNTIPLYTCNGTRLPSAILQGPMSVSGDVTLYNVQGVFDPILGPTGTEGNLTSPYMRAENTWFLIAIARGADPTVYIEVPAVVIEGDAYDIAGPDSVTNRAFTIKGLGGRCDASVTLPPAIISKSDGTYDGPPS
jgi:hypothetical protein